MSEIRLVNAIELVRYMCGACPSHQNGECIDKMCWKYEDRARIENAPTIDVEPVRRWISCDDRLPEIDKNVIVYYSFWKDNPIQIAHLQDDFLFWETSDDEFNFPAIDVTHWMSLPEPPEKG